MRIDPPGGTASDQVPLAYCSRCGQDSITYRELEADGVVVRCLSCGEYLGADGEVDEVLGGAEILASLGYQIGEVRPRGGAGGCRTGGGGCSCQKSSPPKKPKTFQA